MYALVQSTAFLYKDKKTLERHQGKWPREHTVRGGHLQAMWVPGEVPPTHNLILRLLLRAIKKYISVV